MGWKGWGGLRWKKILPRAVNAVTISCTLVDYKSFWRLLTNSIRSSESLFRKRQQQRYPSLFTDNYLLRVMFIAWMCENDESWPNISMYIDFIKFSFYLFRLKFLSFIFYFSFYYSPNIIRSSSCFDRVSPIDFIKSCISFDKWAPADIFCKRSFNFFN